MAERSTYTELYSYKLALIASQFPGVEIHKQRDLCRVERRDVWNGKYGGYRKDILKENLSNRDALFLICGICKGIMREACLISSGEQFCSCCEVRSHYTRKQRSQAEISYLSKHTPNEVVRKTVNSLKCSCPLLERGCEWLGTLNDCEEHLETCGYVRDLCKLGCEAVLHRNILRAHEQENCTYREVKCEHCIQYFTFRHLTTHHKECPKMELSCELKCGVVMCREVMAQHLKQECGLMVETCKLGCGKEMTRNELRIHVTDTCVQRLIQCEHCKGDFNFCDMSAHLDVCPKMEVSCELCDNIMCREDMAQHLEQECVEKVIICPFAKYNCEVTSIKRKHLSQHLEEKETKHLGLKLNAMEDIILKQSEESKQQRKYIDNQITKYIDKQTITNNRMSEHINALCSISDTTKLDWNIENISKFIQINHIPEQRNISGRDLRVHFLKEHIYVSYDNTYECCYTFPAKYLIRLYSTIKCKVVKQYDSGRVDVYGMGYLGEYEKSQIARILKSDAKELSRTGSANRLILEMYITKL